jgi:hypothetical protein
MSDAMPFLKNDHGLPSIAEIVVVLKVRMMACG